MEGAGRDLEPLRLERPCMVKLAPRHRPVLCQLAAGRHGPRERDEGGPEGENHRLGDTRHGHLGVHDCRRR
jgi:hypothetical protein